MQCVGHEKKGCMAAKLPGQKGAWAKEGVKSRATEGGGQDKTREPGQDTARWSKAGKGMSV